MDKSLRNDKLFSKAELVVHADAVDLKSINDDYRMFGNRYTHHESEKSFAKLIMQRSNEIDNQWLTSARRSVSKQRRTNSHVLNIPLEISKNHTRSPQWKRSRHML